MFRCLTLILFLFCFYSGLVAADKTDDNALLLQLDKMIEQREVYQKKVEKEITELRKMLDYVGDDKAKFDILSDLFVMYRSFKVDTALIVAEERLQLADRLGEEYVNQGLMNLADALNKIGKHEKALEVLDRVKRTEAVRKDTYFYYLYHTTYLSCYNDETEASKKRLRVSVLWVRMFVPRLRMRTLGSACAKKRKKRQSISGSNSLNFGLNI